MAAATGNIGAGGPVCTVDEGEADLMRVSSIFNLPRKKYDTGIGADAIRARREGNGG